MLADSGLHREKAQACFKHRVTVGESQHYASIQHCNSSEFLTVMRFKLPLVSWLWPVFCILELATFLFKEVLAKLAMAPPSRHDAKSGFSASFL